MFFLLVQGRELEDALGPPVVKRTVWLVGTRRYVHLRNICFEESLPLSVEFSGYIGAA